MCGLGSSNIARASTHQRALRNRLSRHLRSRSPMGCSVCLHYYSHDRGSPAPWSLHQVSFATSYCRLPLRAVLEGYHKQKDPLYLNSSICLATLLEPLFFCVLMPQAEATFSILFPILCYQTYPISQASNNPQGASIYGVST